MLTNVTSLIHYSLLVCCTVVDALAVLYCGALCNAECSDSCALVPPADKKGFPCYQGSVKDAHVCFDTVST